MTPKTILLSHIDLEDDQFCFNFLAEVRPLTESIRAVGLIHPVIVRALASVPGFQIVSGFLRVRCCSDLKMDRVPAMIWETEELSDRQALLLSFHQTVGSRSLNLIEVSLALRKLRELGGLSEQELTDDILPLCQFQPHRKVLQGLEHLWKLPEGIKAYIVNNEVSPGNAVLFAEFSPQEQEELIRLLEPLKLGTNRLKEFLTLIGEIRHRDDVSIEEMIDDNMRSTLRDENLPVPQKTEAIRGWLKKRRYPRLVRMEDEIRKKTKALKLPPGILFILPPFLEGDQARFEFSVRNTDDLRAVIRKLMEISESSDLDEILNML